MENEFVIRHFPVLGHHGICYATSYQNAFSSTINKFQTRQDAVDFCADRGLKVVLHDYDQLQSNDRQTASI